jgi:hypothetical protein
VRRNGRIVMEYDPAVAAIRRRLREKDRQMVAVLGGLEAHTSS